MYRAVLLRRHIPPNYDFGLVWSGRMGQGGCDNARSGAKRSGMAGMDSQVVVQSDV
jgi:hypothetical protein